MYTLKRFWLLLFCYFLFVFETFFAWRFGLKFLNFFFAYPSANAFAFCQKSLQIGRNLNDLTELGTNWVTGGSSTVIKRAKKKRNMVADRTQIFYLF